MSMAFAKPTFGTLKENLYQSDYINRKKTKNLYCTNFGHNNNKVNKINSYSNLYLFYLNCPVNTTNLVVGQYSKLNLDNVCVVANGAPPSQYCSAETPCDPCQNNTSVVINTSPTANPFYWEHTIDPLGELFGKSQCGELNYTNYMVFMPKLL